MADANSIPQQLGSLVGNAAKDNRRTRKFSEAEYDENLSHYAQILAMAEDINHGNGHTDIFESYMILGGKYGEYDPARWELLRAQYPANRGW